MMPNQSPLDDMTMLCTFELQSYSLFLWCAQAELRIASQNILVLLHICERKIKTRKFITKSERKKVGKGKY